LTGLDNYSTRVFKKYCSTDASCDGLSVSYGCGLTPREMGEAIHNGSNFNRLVVGTTNLQAVVLLEEVALDCRIQSDTHLHLQGNSADEVKEKIMMVFGSNTV
jgi:hypothetical protein